MLQSSALWNSTSRAYTLVPYAHRRAAAAPQIDKCFGFETSVERSQGALMAAKVEARSTRRGIGLVKLMGRSSGFITMQASMASGEQGFQGLGLFASTIASCTAPRQRHDAGVLPGGWR